MKRSTIVILMFLLVVTPYSTKTIRGQQAGSDNQEMRHIFDEDQNDRQTAGHAGWTPEVIKKMGADDERHYKRVRELLAQGALKTGEDFRKAAFIFQHGSKPDDYLVAHILAMVSVSKGDSGGRWIAAATLDRYLHSINQPQVFGTQSFTTDMSSGKWTQEPFNQNLIPEALRKALCVPSCN